MVSHNNTDLNNETAQTNPPAQPNVKVGSEELLEDVFGLNIRSFHSLWALITRPYDYFRAAKTPTWEIQTRGAPEVFTPSLRLWLGLMTIMVALQFIWGGEGSLFITKMMENSKTGFELGYNSSSGGEEVGPLDIDWKKITQGTMDFNLIAYPFVLLILFAIMSTFIRFWGERLSYVVRLRFLFAVLLPASVFNLFATLSLPLIPPSLFTVFTTSQLIVTFLLYVWTAAQGPFKTMSMDDRLPRSLVLAVLLILALIVAQMISIMVSLSVVMLPEVKDIVQAAKAANS